MKQKYCRKVKLFEQGERTSQTDRQTTDHGRTTHAIRRT